MHRIFRLGGVVALYAAIALLMTHPLINLTALGTSSYAGDARLLIWTLAWDNHAVLDHVPLFQANMFFPAANSLRYAEHHFGISLFTLPIYALTRNPTLAYNIVWLLAWVLNGLAMHALAFRYTRSHLASFVAGLVFAFTFYNVLQGHGHLQMIWTWPIPLSLLLLERWHDRPAYGRGTLWGLVVMLEIVSSWYLAVFILIVNATLLVWRMTQSRWAGWRHRVATLAPITLAGAAFAWPFAWHYQYLPPASLQEARTFSADWISYFVPPVNTVAGQWWLQHIGRQPRGIYTESALFLGWIATALGVAGLVAAWRSRQLALLAPFLAGAGFGFVMSFGPAGVTGLHLPGLFDLVWKLPLLNGMRAVARFSVLVDIGVSLAAAFAVAAWRRRFPRVTPWLVAALVPLMLAEWRVVNFPAGQPQPLVIPAIYDHPLLKTARAIVSVPSFHYGQEWWHIPDYLVFSTRTWRPIVNGYGRAEPENYGHIISHVNAFPGPNNAKTMKEIGVEYIVFRSGEYQDAAELLAVVRQIPAYELVAQSGTDYLIRIR